MSMQQILDILHTTRQVNAITYQWKSQFRQVQLIKMTQAKLIRSDLHEQLSFILERPHVKPVLTVIREILVELDHFLENNWTEDGMGGAHHASLRIYELTNVLRGM